MKKQHHIKASVQDKALKLNLKAFEAILSEFEGQDVDVAIQKWKKTRSNPQNAYYWGVVIKHIIQAIKDQWGDILTPDEAHAFVKSEILGEMKEVGDYWMRIPQSTKTKDTLEFENSMEEVRNFIQRHFEYTIPLPNEDLTTNQK